MKRLEQRRLLHHVTEQPQPVLPLARLLPGHESHVHALGLGDEFLFGFDLADLGESRGQELFGELIVDIPHAARSSSHREQSNPSTASLARLARRVNRVREFTIASLFEPLTRLDDLGESLGEAGRRGTVDDVVVEVQGDVQDLAGLDFAVDETRLLGDAADGDPQAMGGQGDPQPAPEPNIPTEVRTTVPLYFLVIRGLLSTMRRKSRRRKPGIDVIAIRRRTFDSWDGSSWMARISSWI